MAVSLTHSTVAAGTNSGTGEIHKAEWNAGHTLTLVGPAVLGKASAGSGNAVELTIGAAAGNILDKASGDTLYNAKPSVVTAVAGSAIGPAIADYFTSTLSLDANSTYMIEAHAYFQKTTAGTVQWTWLFSSAPTVVSSHWEGTPISGFTTISTAAPTFAQASAESAATIAHAVTGTLTTAVRHSFKFWVQIRTNAATTMQLRATESAGTITPQTAGSYMRATKVA